MGYVEEWRYLPKGRYPKVQRGFFALNCNFLNFLGDLAKKQGERVYSAFEERLLQIQVF